MFGSSLLVFFLYIFDLRLLNSILVFSSFLSSSYVPFLHNSVNWYIIIVDFGLVLNIHEFELFTVER